MTDKHPIPHLVALLFLYVPPVAERTFHGSENPVETFQVTGDDVILDSTCFEKQKVTVHSDLDPGEVQDLGRDRSWVLALARLAQAPEDTFLCNQ